MVSGTAKGVVGIASEPVTAQMVRAYRSSGRPWRAGIGFLVFIDLLTDAMSAVVVMEEHAVEACGEVSMDGGIDWTGEEEGEWSRVRGQRPRCTAGCRRRRRADGSLSSHPRGQSCTL